jgi:spore maturation protein CgeB
MIKIFNTSRINLNLTASYGANSDDKTEASSRKRHPLWRLLERIPLTTTRKESTTRCEQSSPASEPNYSSLSDLAGHSTEQIKGRNFEVPGTGGFLLTQHAAHLEDYYEPGREVVSFHSTAEMIEKVRYYLTHDAERTAIAETGYRRTLRDHTYQQRFQDIFAQIGLAEHSSPTDGDRPVVTGQTHEVR